MWRRAFLGPADFNNYVRVVYDALARFLPDGARIEPKIAAGWQSSPDFKTWTIRLRKGARWSDGAPFTADDIVLWHKDVVLNKDLMSAVPGWMRNGDGTAASVEKVDAQTVRFTYKQPATLFLTALANQDGGDRTYAVFLPAHYRKKFHPAHAKKEDIDKLVQAAGSKMWTESLCLLDEALQPLDLQRQLGLIANLPVRWGSRPVSNEGLARPDPIDSRRGLT